MSATQPVRIGIAGGHVWHFKGDWKPGGSGHLGYYTTLCGKRADERWSPRSTSVGDCPNCLRVATTGDAAEDRTYPNRRPYPRRHQFRIGEFPTTTCTRCGAPNPHPPPAASGPQQHPEFVVEALGYDPRSPSMRCPTCSGTGSVPADHDIPHGSVEGYRMELRRGLATCDPCRAAFGSYKDGLR